MSVFEILERGSFLGFGVLVIRRSGWVAKRSFVFVHEILSRNLCISIEKWNVFIVPHLAFYAVSVKGVVHKKGEEVSPSSAVIFLLALIINGL